MRIDKKALRESIAYLEGAPVIPFDPYPQYPGEVWACLGFLPPDYDYLSHHERLTEKGTPIGEMTLGELGTMFTFLTRGERFCDGHIAASVEDGTLLALLRRLDELT